MESVTMEEHLDLRERRLELARDQLRSAHRDGALSRYAVRNENRRQQQQQQQVETEPVRSPLFPWTPHLQTILCGTRDEGSTLSALRGHEDTVLKKIYSYLVEWWQECVTLTPPAYTVGRLHTREGQTENVLYQADERRSRTLLGIGKENRPEIAFTRCGWVEFPPGQDRNVNMLPFIMGDPESLPEDLQPYYDSVIVHCPVEVSEIGKVVYLTVSESFVRAGETQRRPGLHVEAPGSFTTEASFTAALEHPWGMGRAYTPDELHGGFFLASNRDSTCKVWNALVRQPGAVDSHGGMEHLRPFLGPGYKMAAQELVWLTDKTPHEALPQEEDGYRQFFRLVTSEISVWFAEHSTANPKVPLPDFVQVIEGNKFEQNAMREALQA